MVREYKETYEICDLVNRGSSAYFQDSSVWTVQGSYFKRRVILKKFMLINVFAGNDVLRNFRFKIYARSS